MRRALKDGPHLARDQRRIAVEPARDLLELVEEQHEPAIVSRGDALSQLPRGGQRAFRVASLAHAERDLDPVAEILARAIGHRGAQRLQHASASGRGGTERSAQRRPVRQHSHGKGLGKLRGIGDAEQIDARDVAPLSLAHSEGGIADARLAGAARAGNDEVGAPQ
jgi:hypothetical protein